MWANETICWVISWSRRHSERSPTMAIIRTVNHGQGTDVYLQVAEAVADSKATKTILHRYAYIQIARHAFDILCARIIYRSYCHYPVDNVRGCAIQVWKPSCFLCCEDICCCVGRIFEQSIQPTEVVRSEYLYMFKELTQDRICVLIKPVWDSSWDPLFLFVWRLTSTLWTIFHTLV